MAFLASVLCTYPREQDRDDNAFPVTDLTLLPHAFSPPTTFSIRLTQLGYQIITDVLPVPGRWVEACDIREFQEDHRDQLQRLRRKLDLELAHLARVEDDDERLVLANLTREDILDDINSLRSKMEKREWPKVSLLSLDAIAATGLALGSMVLTPGTPPLALGLAAGGVAISGFSPILETLKSNEVAQDEPLAYAAIAAKVRCSEGIGGNGHAEPGRRTLQVPAEAS